MGSPGPSPTVTPADALTVFTDRDDPAVPLTASEVGEALDCSRRTAYDKLETLAERDELASKKVGARGRVWWRPAAVATTDDRPAGGDGTTGGEDDAGVGGVTTDEDGRTVEATQFEELVDTVADYAIFLLDVEGRVRTWNRGAERLKGYDESEIVGEHFSTFYTEDDREAHVPERNLAYAARDGRVEDEGWRLRADGSRFWANVVITALRDDDGEVTGYAKVTRDMTDRHEYEERLREEKERFQTLVREVGDYAIFMLDPSGVVESWNAGIEEIKGYAESEIVGEHFSTFYTEDDREAHVPDRNLAYAARDGRVEDEGWRLRADGSRFWANVVITALRDDDGDLRGFAKVTRDMTERHDYEERLERQRDELDELNRINTVIRDVDQSLIGATNRDEIEDSVCSSLAASETSLGVWIGAYDAHRTTVTPRASAGLGDGPESVLADDGEDGPYLELGRRALETGASVSRDDGGWDGDDDRDPSLASDADHESVIAFPIVYGDAEYGVLFLHHRPDDSFDERQREVLEELCGTIGHAIAAIERKEREETLTTLHESTRSLLRTESPEEVGDVVVETVTEELGLDDALVLGFETTTNTLEPLSTSLDRDVDEMGTLSAADDSPAWTTFVEERTIALGPDDEPVVRTAELANHGELVVPLSDHGVLVATTRSRDAFDPDSRKLVELVAAWADAAMDRVEQRANLRERDEILQERNRRLKRLDRVNTLVRDVDRALVKATTVEEVRRVVCERLTDDDRFPFAWIGEAGEDEVLLARAWSGDERAYLDEVDFGSPANDSEPAVRALRSKSVAVVSNVASDLRAAPWRKTAFAREFQSAIGVPLRYGDVTYGVLTVYANEPDVFGDVERSVFPVLGETIANAIDGVQTKEALLTDRTAELEFRLTDESASVLSRIAVETGCRVVLDGAVPLTEGSVRLYVTTHDVDREAVEAAAGNAPDVASMRHVWTEDRSHRFEVEVAGTSIPVTLSDLGASLRDLRVTAEEVRVVADVPASTDVRQFVRQFQDVYPGAEFVARRQREDLDDSPDAYRVGLDEALTDRQREVLQTAYHSGFFDSPRRSTGEDIADSLDVSQPTVTEHLRTAQAKLLDAVVGDDVAVDATAAEDRDDGDV